MDKNNNTEFEEHFLGSGWAFPVTFSVGNYQLETSWYEDNVNDNINIILQTNTGERVMQPDFGSGLQQHFFKNMTNGLKGQIADTVTNALLHHEPRITVLNVQVEFTDNANGLVEINILYLYNQTNTRHNHIYPFYLKEGTNL